MGYTDWGTNAVVVLVTLALVLGSVVGHYEGLSAVSLRLSARTAARRRRVLVAVLAAIGLHIAEIWLFGVGIWVLLQGVPEAGEVVGLGQARLLDSVYLSAVTYTTVGFGDLTPTGPLRFLIGTEALVGFVLITWSASFTYLEMERNWKLR